MQLLLGICIFTSCVPRKEIVYFQNIEDMAKESKSVSSPITLKPNDLLSITVSAANLESVRPFNVMIEARPPVGSAGVLNSNNVQQAGYLVDSEGYIYFPVLGSIKVEGMQPEELHDKLTQELKTYVKDPIVNIRILNFQVSVLGEVARPGTYSVTGQRISLPEALGLAGDLTIYGRRDNVLIIREKEGKKTYQYLDLRNSDILDSPFYYLQQNDVVYVEPNNAQRQSSSFNRNTSVYISIASLLISVLVIIFR